MNNLGDRLKYIRETLDIKQKDVAQKLQINNKTLSNYENNVSSPDPNTIRLLCEFYQVSSDYLLGICDLKQNNNKNSYEEVILTNTPIFREFSNDYKSQNEVCPNTQVMLTNEEKKILTYYNRLNEENKDSAKGTLVNLYKEQQYSAQNEQKNANGQNPPKSLTDN